MHGHLLLIMIFDPITHSIHPCPLLLQIHCSYIEYPPTMPAPNSCSDGETLTIRRPDDFHVHFRDGEMLKVVAPFTASIFSRAIVMPNLIPPVRTVKDAKSYHDRIMNALPPNTSFTPLMTLYLTDTTTADHIRDAHASGLVKACKIYPHGVTTNSAHGVTSLDSLAPALTAMQELGLILCIHGESTDPNMDIFDREADFIDKTLPGLLSKYPTLKIVLEHVTTAEAAAFVQSQPPTRLAATITAHHLLYSRQALFASSKLHPHMFCLPILKRDTHRQALLQAVAKDDAGQFFAGTDSAPHPQSSKICSEGCAGVFTAHAALPFYAEAFEKAGMMHRLQGFMSENGARFYGLPLNEEMVTLCKKTLAIPDKFDVPSMEPLIPLRAGENVSWVVDTSS